MKICFVAPGRSVHTLKWCRHFVGRGYDVHLISDSPVGVQGVVLHRLKSYFPGRKLSFPIWALQMRKIVGRADPDIVHGHYISSYGVLAAFSGFHPLILSAWGSDIAVDPERSKVVKVLVKYAMKKSDLVQVGDISGEKRLVELGCDEDRIFIQPSGVDTGAFSPAARSKELRAKLEISDKYSVLNARWLKPSYNVDVFIEAVPLVLEKIDSVKFIVGGGGPQEGELKELTKKLGIERHVIFIGGIPHEEMPKYLASADLYVDTVSVSKGGGGIGTTTMEAMACETPQVLGDSISVRSGGWFQGLMYKQLNSRDLSRKIIRLLEDEEFRKDIGKRSRKKALEIGDWERNIAEWEKIYNRYSRS